MKKKRGKKRWLIIIGLLLVALIAIFLLTRPSAGTARYAEEAVRNGNIETYYSFSGNIAVRDSQSINAKVNATVREIYATQDQIVAVNDPLMRLSSGDIIKADIAGEVTDIHVAENDAVSMGAPLVDIVNFDDLQVVIKVDEFDVAAVTAGANATVTIDALGLVYETTVEHISKQALSVGDINYYEAKLDAPTDERILPGMKVDVKILAQSAENTMLLSMNALQFDAYNKPYVNIRNSAGEVIAQDITVGIQDGTTVQIVDGLRAGDVVLLPQSRTMFPMMGGMGSRNGN